MNRIYIDCYGFGNDWIMGKIADDIIESASQLGYECSSSLTSKYDRQDIVYHLAYHIAIPYSHAKHNSVFYTHLNDKLQENNLLKIKDKFDSYICMSQEDAQYLIELGFPADKVFGRTLPVRNTYIKPVSIGIFSACYPDGRKNEKWLIDFCKSEKNALNINFVFIGMGWGNVVSELEQIGCSFEWHNVSRKLPYEYQFQQNKLVNLNYYIYMGMDGGAMGTYDAYAQDIPLCVTYDGYHKSIPDIDYTFDNKDTFFDQLKAIASKHARRLDFFSSHSAKNYVNWIIKVWLGHESSVISDDDKKCLSYNSVTEKKRTQYYNINYTRIREHILKQYRKFRLRSQRQ